MLASGIKPRPSAPDIDGMDLQLAPSPSSTDHATAWLFLRGEESVRITRSPLHEGNYRLLIEGPGDAEQALYFSDLIMCVEKQMEVEYTLLVKGFHLERLTSDRRRRNIPPPAGSRRRRGTV